MTVDFPVHLVFDDLFLPAFAVRSQSEVKGYIQSAPSVQDTHHIRLYRATQGVGEERT